TLSNGWRAIAKVTRLRFVAREQPMVDLAPGKRFVVLSGEERIIYDQDISAVEDEDARHRRKGARDD
ncbi:MAG: hypothetical protein WAL20_17810, partial [Rhodomicrobium sp.]